MLRKLQVNVTITILTIFFLMATTSALIKNPSVPNMDQPKVQPSSIIINISGEEVNNSIYWNGHAFVNGAVSSIETDPLAILADGSKQLSGDWGFGNQKIYGTGEINASRIVLSGVQDTLYSYGQSGFFNYSFFMDNVYMQEPTRGLTVGSLIDPEEGSIRVLNNGTFGDTVTASRFTGDNTISRAGNYNCTGSNVLQNVTSNSSGIFGQCIAVSSGSSYNYTYNNLLNQNCPAGKIVNGTLANGTFICTTDQTGGAGGGEPRWLNGSIDEYINSSYPQGLRVNGSDYSNFTFIGERCGGTPQPCSEYDTEEVCITEDSGGCYWDCTDETCNEYSCQGIPDDCTYHPPSTCTNYNGCGMVSDDVFKVIGRYGDIAQKGTKSALAGGVLSNYEFTLTGSRGAECLGDFCVSIGDGATAYDSGLSFGAGATAFSNAVAIANCLADSHGVCIGEGNEVASYAVGVGQGLLVGGVYSTGVGYYGDISGSNSFGVATAQFGGTRWLVSGDFSGLVGTKQTDEVTLLDVVGDRSILVGNAKLYEDTALYGSDSLALMSYGLMYGNNSVFVGWNASQTRNNVVELGWGKIQQTMNSSGTYLYESPTLTNASAYTNYVVCYLAGGKLGHCTSIVGVGGTCTCVSN